MILKLKEKDWLAKGSTTWRYFEDINEYSITPGIVKDGKVHVLIYAKDSSDEKVVNEEISKEPVDVDNIYMAINSEYVSIVFLYKSPNDLWKVLAIQEAYMLNNQGKTIETV